MGLERTVGGTDRLAEIIEANAGLDGPLLPILHAVQHAFGFIPKSAVPTIAQALNLSRAEVHGVVTFYQDFRQTPPGRHVLRLCRAEACQARGAAAVEAKARELLSVEMDATTADGAVTLEAVYCLGLCASGPAAMLDDAPMARLNPQRIEALIAEIVA
jgi:formate dehydrogenase subunit gamma